MSSQQKVNLSVIVPTYNRGEVFIQTIRQLLLQDPMPLEIIVIDQSSVQYQEVRDFIGQLPGDGTVKYIYQEIPSANVARNRGAREANGEILLFMDDDIRIGTGLVGAHYRNYQDNSIAAISGAVLEPGQSLVADFPRRYYYPFTGWIYFPLNYARRVKTANLNSCNLSIRRGVFLESGGFDENFVKTIYDDSDLAVRVQAVCRKKRLSIVHDPQASLEHLVTVIGGNRPSGVDQYVIADRDTWNTWLYFFINNYGLLGAWEILLRLRRCVFRKKNILHPKYLLLALKEFALGFRGGLRLIRRGRKLPFLADSETVRS